MIFTSTQNTFFSVITFSIKSSDGIHHFLVFNASIIFNRIFFILLTSLEYNGAMVSISFSKNNSPCNFLILILMVENQNWNFFRFNFGQNYLEIPLIFSISLLIKSRSPGLSLISLRFTEILESEVKYFSDIRYTLPQFVSGLI